MRRRRLCVVVCTVLLAGPAATAAPVEPSPGAAQGFTMVADLSLTPAGTYRWPLPGFPRLTRPFQPPASTYGPGHRGVDLAAPPGASVLAASSGTVVFAGLLAGRGVVSVQHPDGLRTTYEPVAAVVVAGEVVAGGAALGALQPGHTGCPATACLHWGVRRGPIEYLDPLRLIGRWAVRLLPWRD